MSLHGLNGISTRALENVRSAIVVTDAGHPDYPIIYVNPAFETLTGYSFGEVLGRNCRFLQREDTAQAGQRTIREALANKRAVRAVLRNYRKDGSLFFNELLIDPICNSEGKVTHFVGCQNEIAGPDKAYVLQDGLTGFEQLSERERQVFAFMTRGHTNKSIGEKLHISPRTVEKHRNAVH